MSTNARTLLNSLRKAKGEGFLKALHQELQWGYKPAYLPPTAGSTRPRRAPYLDGERNDRLVARKWEEHFQQAARHTSQCYALTGKTAKLAVGLGYPIRHQYREYGVLVTVFEDTDGRLGTLV